MFSRDTLIDDFLSILTYDLVTLTYFLNVGRGCQRRSISITKLFKFRNEIYMSDILLSHMIVISINKLLLCNSKIIFDNSVSVLFLSTSKTNRNSHKQMELVDIYAGKLFLSLPLVSGYSTLFKTFFSRLGKKRD